MSDNRLLASRKRRRMKTLLGLALIAPAAVAYFMFSIRPLFLTFQYSFYKWNGISEATFIGLGNYAKFFTDPKMIDPIVNAFQLIVFFAFIPILLALATAAIIRRIAASRLATISRTVLFLPQVIPLVAAGIMWSWIMAGNGVINQVMDFFGLDSVTRAWLGDIGTALPAVGVIGAWVNFGLCLLLLLAGMSKIDPALYEAARIDGANAFREFMAVTLPAVRQELVVCLTLTVISAIKAFDIVYISTFGGPANATMVPGLQIYQMAFFERNIGKACALGVALMLLVWLVVLPLQRIGGKGDEK